MEFAMVDISLVYNVILGRTVLNYHGIIINVGAMCLKLLAPGGLTIVQPNQKSTQECYRDPTESLEKVTIPINLLEKPNSHIKLESIDPVEEEIN